MGEAKGNYWDGVLVNGISCTSEFQKRSDRIEICTYPESHWATKAMLDMLLEAADWAHDRWKGEVKLRVGDIAFEHGGKIAAHKTHQTGLDADISFIAKDPKPINFNTPGRHDKFPEKFVRRGRLNKNFDVAKNYELISHFFEKYDVLMFADRRIISALRGYKMEGQSPELRERMFAGLEHNPGHQNHFHVKLTCPQDYKECRNEMDKRRWYKYQRKKWPTQFGIQKKYDRKQQTIYYTLEKNQTIQVNTTHSLEANNEKITRAIVAIHGYERNAKAHFDKIKKLTERSGSSEKIIVVVPNFKDHHEKYTLSNVSWDDGWEIGDQANEESDLNSFDVVDHLVKKIADKQKFPNLTTIVFTGLATGAEFVQRYAAGNTVENESKDIHFKYVVMAPGSFMYLTPQRILGNSYELGIPPAIDCKYDDYSYGRQNRNNYMSRINDEVLRNQYISRDVTYVSNKLESKKKKTLPPSDDTLDFETIDRNCEAEIQGHTRTERLQFFKSYLEKAYPQAKHNFESVTNRIKKLEIYEDKVVKKILLE